MSSVLFSHLAAEHMPQAWAGTYDEVLPYLQNALNDALSAVKPNIPQEVQADIILMIRQLSEPDLSKRGHPRDRFRSGNTFRLDRYISKLNELAYKAERKLF